MSEILTVAELDSHELGLLKRGFLNKPRVLKLIASHRLLSARVKELEAERDAVCKTAKVRKHLSGTNRTFLDYP